MPVFDAALLEAGEQSGRLPECLTLLARSYDERARLTRQALADLGYPLFLFHFAVLVAPFPRFIQTGDALAYGTQVLGILLPVYAVVALLIDATRSRHGERWRSAVETMTQPIPLVGRAWRSLALARLAAALEALLNAGVSVFQAWDLAAAASGSPALRRAVASWKPRLAAGETPGEALRRSPEFPEAFATMYYTGEVSGQLDDTLRHLHTLYLEQGSHQLRLLAQWVPRLVYLAIMLMVAYQVIAFWTRYFAQIGELIP
jgi:type II secretory pathway component PulF